MRFAQLVTVVELEGSTRLDRRLAAQSPEWPAKPLGLSEDERHLLRDWADESRAAVKWDALRKRARIDRLELADRLSSNLLRAGVCELREKFDKGFWRCVELSWTDLPALQAELGLETDADRQLAKAEVQTQLRALFDDEWVGEVSGQLLDSPATLKTKRARTELLAGLGSWIRAEASGLRQDFALHARPHTKAIVDTEWEWLERHFDLAGLRIGRFMPVLWLAGDAALSSATATIDLRFAPLLGLPCETITSLSALVNPPAYYWLIENRASFEKQALQRPEGCCLVWTAGRPANAWLRALQALLRLAPAPAWISADADPAGIEIAMAAVQPWRTAGLPWEPRYMDDELLREAKRLPLNTYDLRCLQRLQEEPDLPPMLARLAEAMRQLQGKAEQEAWL